MLESAVAMADVAMDRELDQAEAKLNEILGSK
jgi:hypothetical protein